MLTPTNVDQVGILEATFLAATIRYGDKNLIEKAMLHTEMLAELDAMTASSAPFIEIRLFGDRIETTKHALEIMRNMYEANHQLDLALECCDMIQDILMQECAFYEYHTITEIQTKVLDLIQTQALSVTPTEAIALVHNTTLALKNAIKQFDDNDHTTMAELYRDLFADYERQVIQSMSCLIVE